MRFFTTPRKFSFDTATWMMRGNEHDEVSPAMKFKRCHLGTMSDEESDTEENIFVLSLLPSLSKRLSTQSACRIDAYSSKKMIVARPTSRNLPVMLDDQINIATVNSPLFRRNKISTNIYSWFNYHIQYSQKNQMRSKFMIWFSTFQIAPSMGSKSLGRGVSPS